METPIRTDVLAEADAQSAVSWASVAAGAVVAAASSLGLLALGVGLGLSSVSPWTDSGVSASTFKNATGIYMVAVAVMASAMGGYLAARLRTRWIGVNTNEVFFRDTAVLESLCIPSSSVCKHWNRVVVSDATRATFSGHRVFDRLRRQVGGANLVRRAGHNLHRWQRAGFDQAAYCVACGA